MNRRFFTVEIFGNGRVDMVTPDSTGTSAVVRIVPSYPLVGIETSTTVYPVPNPRRNSDQLVPVDSELYLNGVRIEQGVAPVESRATGIIYCLKNIFS